MIVDFKWKRSPEEISAHITGKEAQLFLANEAKKMMDPYVPAENMMLSKAVRVSMESGKGIVHYQSPYARYQFEGNVMISKNPGIKRSAKVVKQPKKAIVHSKFRHPLATTHWDKAMMAARKDDLVQALQSYIKKR